jgi:peroxiredoxin
MSILSPGKPAPPFQLATTAGERLSLPEGLSGGPVLLAFFKISCPTCQFTFPFLERLHRQMGAQGLRIWGVVQDKAPDAARFATAYGVTFPILVDDPPYKVSRAYGLSHVPSLFLVQADGQIEISGDGFSKSDLLAIQRSMAQLLAAMPPALFLPAEKIPEYKPG